MHERLSEFWKKGTKQVKTEGKNIKAEIGKKSGMKLVLACYSQEPLFGRRFARLGIFHSYLMSIKRRCGALYSTGPCNRQTLLLASPSCRTRRAAKKICGKFCSYTNLTRTQQRGKQRIFNRKKRKNQGNPYTTKASHTQYIEKTLCFSHSATIRSWRCRAESYACAPRHAPQNPANSYSPRVKPSTIPSNALHDWSPAPVPARPKKKKNIYILLLLLNLLRITSFLHRYLRRTAAYRVLLVFLCDSIFLAAFRWLNSCLVGEPPVTILLGHAPPLFFWTANHADLRLAERQVRPRQTKTVEVKEARLVKRQTTSKDIPRQTKSEERLSRQSQRTD